MTDKEQIIVDGKIIGCPCYIDRPLHRYHKGCLVQSQAFKEQQTEEKPILRCDEIKNCPIKENFKQLQCKTQECESLKEEIEVLKDNFDTATRDCNELIEELKQECEEYKKRSFCFKDVNKQLGYKYLTIKQECEKLLKENQQLRNSLSDSLMFKFTGQENETNRYRKALEEIEKVINNILNSCLGRNTVSCRPAHNVCGDLINILDIINKAKGEVDE